MSIAAVTLTEVNLIWLMYVGLILNKYIYTDKNLSNPKMTVGATFKSSKYKNILWSLWPWKQGEGQTYDMQYKVCHYAS